MRYLGFVVVAGAACGLVAPTKMMLRCVKSGHSREPFSSRLKALRQPQLPPPAAVVWPLACGGPPVSGCGRDRRGLRRQLLVRHPPPCRFGRAGEVTGACSLVGKHAIVAPEGTHVGGGVQGV